MQIDGQPIEPPDPAIADAEYDRLWATPIGELIEELDAGQTENIRQTILRRFADDLIERRCADDK